jgi:hypothetical protein
MVRLRKKKLHMDSVEAYACACIWAACVCNCVCDCGCNVDIASNNRSIDTDASVSQATDHSTLYATEVSGMQYQPST